MKPQSKHQNQAWHRCQDNQTRNLNNYEEHAKGCNGQSRQHAKTDGQYKQRARNPKKKTKEMIEIRNTNRNEECI